MIIKDQLDRGMRRVSGVKNFEEFNELAAAVPVPDQSVNLASEQIDSGQQAHRTMTLVLVVARKTGMGARFWRQVRTRARDRLQTGLLVIRDDRHRLAGLLLGGSLLEDCDLAVDAQHFGHLLRKLGVAAFEVVAHFVWLHLLAIQDLADRALDQLGEALMTGGRSVLPRVAGQQPRRPQLVRIAELFRLLACQRHQPSLGFGGDRRLFTWPWTVLERRHGAIGHRALNASLYCLMMKSQGVS